MARIPRGTANKDSADEYFDSFIGKAPTKKKPLRPSQVLRYVREVEEMIRSKDFSGFLVSHSVAMHMWCYERVYQTEALDLKEGTEFTRARQRAGQLLKKHFSGDLDQFRQYVQWVWRREKGREEWRRTNSTQGSILGWRLVFSPTLVVQYRVELARKRGEL